jgi:hypothetical protein
MNNSVFIDINQSWNIIWIIVMNNLLNKSYIDKRTTNNPSIESASIVNRVSNIISLLSYVERKIQLDINQNLDFTQGLLSLLHTIVEFYYFENISFLGDNMDLLSDIVQLFNKYLIISPIISDDFKKVKLIVSVPSTISDIIWTNIYGYKYKIVDWINPHTTFDWIIPLNKNPHIIDYIYYKSDYFDYDYYLFWESLAENEYAIDLILNKWLLIPQKQDYDQYYEFNYDNGRYEYDFEIVENYNYFWHSLAKNINDRVLDIIDEYYDDINKTRDLVISLAEREIKRTNLNYNNDNTDFRGLYLINRIINENFREVSNHRLWANLALVNNDYAIRLILSNSITLNIDIINNLFINPSKLAYEVFTDIIINQDILGYQVSMDEYGLLPIIKYFNENYINNIEYFNQVFENDNIVDLLVGKYYEYSFNNSLNKDYLIFIAQHNNDKIVKLIIKDYKNISAQFDEFLNYFAMNKNILAVEFILSKIESLNLHANFWVYFSKNRNIIAIEYILENYKIFNNLKVLKNLLVNDEEQIEDTGIIDLISKNWQSIFQVIKQDLNNVENLDNLNKSKKFLETLAKNKRAIKLIEINFLDILDLIGKNDFYNVFLMSLYKNPNILIKDNSLGKYLENIYTIFRNNLNI